MKADTAETLLRYYRPGKRADAKMEKALRVAEEDAELKKILSAQLEFDEQIVDVIHFIKPPENLRQKLSDLSVKPRAEKARLRKQVINPAVVTALCGVLVILGIIVFFVMERMEKFPGREGVEAMLNNASKMNGTELEPMTSTAGQMGDWFYIHGYDGFEAPGEMGALPVVGARVFRVDGRTVSQFAVGDENEMRYLVLQFHASEFGVVLPEENHWKVLTEGEWAGALRQHGDHCFLVAKRGSKAEMEELLKTIPAPAKP